MYGVMSRKKKKSYSMKKAFSDMDKRMEASKRKMLGSKRPKSRL